MKPKVNKAMFYVGLLIIAIDVVLLLGNFLSDDSSVPVIFGFLGILFIATSGVRPLRNG